MSSFLLVINPTAGSRKGLEYADRAAQVLVAEGHSVKFAAPATAAAAGTLIDDEREQCDAVLVCGGDGMVHLAVQHLAGRHTPLGVIPAGTGNDAARSWGLPLDAPEEAARLILSHAPSTIDAGLVRPSHGPERWFAQILSGGFDAVVNERANAMRWPRGRSRYNIAILAELPRFKPEKFRLIVDGVERNVEAMLIAIANGPSYGGGMLVCPDASYQDGLFDIMVLSPLGKARFMALFPRVYSGAHVAHEKVEIVRGRHIRLEGSAVTYADGERVGTLPLDVLLVPGALQVWLGDTPR